MFLTTFLFQEASVFPATAASLMSFFLVSRTPYGFSTDLVQRRALMHRNVFGLVAFDFVLRFVGASVVRVALVFGVFRMHLDDRATYAAGFRVPAHVIVYLEFCDHLNEFS